MRVSSNMLVEQMITNLQRNIERLSQQQDRIASGKRVRRPSDDPAATERALRFRAQLTTLDQHLRNIDTANVWLATTDNTLESMGDVLHRARELMIQGRTGTMRPDDRRAISREIDELLKRMVELGNTTLAGRSLFAGTRTTSPAFTATTNASGQITDVTYNGVSSSGTPPDPTKDILQNIDDGVTIAVNVTGDLFVPIFSTLIALRDQLDSGTAPTDTVFNDFDNRLETMSDLRARAGAILNRVEQTADRLSQVQVSMTELLSKAEDLDMAEAIMTFSTQQAVYQASLGAAARVIQPSLLDFLR